jgi:hypothetical protein
MKKWALSGGAILVLAVGACAETAILPATYETSWKAALEVMKVRPETLDVVKKSEGRIVTRQMEVDTGRFSAWVKFPDGSEKPAYDKGRYLMELCLIKRKAQSTQIAVSATPEYFGTPLGSSPRPPLWYSCESNRVLERSFINDLRVKIKGGAR